VERTYKPGGAGGMTECPELPRVHALADGELVSREVAHVRRHLAHCARCRSELAFLMQLSMAIARGVLATEAIGRPS
jgi:anti-sigma factor RsiW